jgi:hypothetical protein
MLAKLLLVLALIVEEKRHLAFFVGPKLGQQSLCVIAYILFLEAVVHVLDDRREKCTR